MLFTILRASLGLATLGVIAFTGRRAWRALRRPRADDMVYALFFGLALSRIILIGKGFVYPNPPTTQVEAAATFLAYVIGTAAEIGVLARLYWQRHDG